MLGTVEHFVEVQNESNVFLEHFSGGREQAGGGGLNRGREAEREREREKLDHYLPRPSDCAVRVKGPLVLDSFSMNACIRLSAQAFRATS